MGNIKQIKIKNRTYKFFNDLIIIKDFDSSLPKIDQKSYKNTGIYNIAYISQLSKLITMKIFTVLILCI